MSQPYIISTLFLAVVLLIGFVLRARVRWLRVLFVPASVVGGFVGFGLMQTALRVEGLGLTEPAREIFATLYRWPGVLIAVVFSGLLLERSGKSFTTAVRQAARQGIVAWIIILGEMALGLLVTWLLVMPFYDVPPSFGQLIETGWAGGHGTAGAMGDVFNHIGFADGRDLGFFFATTGLVWGVISGIVLVNIGVRRGWTRSGEHRTAITTISGLEARDNPTPVAYARVRGEVIDPLVFQVLILAMAFLVGVVLRWGFITACAVGFTPEQMAFIENVPLFLFTLLGGWVVREVMHLIGVGDLIDGESIRRLVAWAMEFLIVAAIATLRIEAISAYFLPSLLLMGVAAVWCVVCLVFIGRKLLPPEYWFELGLINYGFSTATTAQGMMLLRIVDPDLDSGAAEDYAVAAPMTAPFIGGGIITVTLPLVLQTIHVGWIVGLFLIAIIALWFLGRALAARRTNSHGVALSTPARAER